MSRFSHVEIPEIHHHSSCAAKSLSSSDILGDYSRITPSRPHKWSLEDQVTLILLVESYEITWAQREKIFNSYMRDVLNPPHTFSEGALRSQYAELKNKFSGPFGSWHLVRKALETKAGFLCIPLIHHAEASPPRTPAKRRFDESITGLPTPTSSRKSFPPTKFPRLGFRAFDISNQGVNSATEFRAGRFIDGDIPVPPTPHSFVYRNDARKQIERVHEGSTPFISTTSSLLRALSYAYSRKHPASIAVIDLHEAGKVKDYEDENNPFLQNVYQLNLKPGDPYKGTSEFLIFGEIKKEAILCVLTLTQLISRLPTLSSNDDPFGLRYLQPSETLRESSECLCESLEYSCKSSKYLRDVRYLIGKNPLATNFSTGHLVGKLVKGLELPAHYLNDGVSVITKDWRFRGSRRNDAFKRGVSDGFRQDYITRSLDLGSLGCPRLKDTLESAAVILDQEEYEDIDQEGYEYVDQMEYEDVIHARFEEMSWSSDTRSEYFSDAQKPQEFFSNVFMQEVLKAAKISGQQAPCNMNIS